MRTRRPLPCMRWKSAPTGGAGTDKLIGIGNLTGSALADTLTGDAGFDLLQGGMGQDIMTGGPGSDRFEFNNQSETGPTAATADRITDFTPGQDRIDLFDIDADPAHAGEQPFTFIGIAALTAPGQAHIVRTASNTFVELETAGPTGPEAMMELDGLVPLTATDLLL